MLNQSIHVIINSQSYDPNFKFYILIWVDLLTRDRINPWCVWLHFKVKQLNYLIISYIIDLLFFMLFELKWL
jgi:hypothetical protein